MRRGFAVHIVDELINMQFTTYRLSQSASKSYISQFQVRPGHKIVLSNTYNEKKGNTGHFELFCT